MRALVTGIRGFAGGHLAEHLLASGDAVLGVASRRKGATESPTELRHVRPVAWDIRTEIDPSVRQAIEQFAPDVIYHLAARAVPAECGDEEPNEPTKATNIEGTRRVIELALALATRPRLLFTSSSHVYAPVTPARYRVAEDWPLDPRQGYGRSKLAAEQIVERAVKERGLEAVIARAFQHTGPRQRPPMMLPQWVEQFVDQSRPPVVVKYPNAHIDLNDVRDVVRAYRLLVQHGQPGVAYNIGSGVPLPCRVVFDELRRLADPERLFEVGDPKPKYDPIADIGRVQGATGWKPEIHWKQTVADTLLFWQQRAVARRA